MVKSSNGRLAALALLALTAPALAETRSAPSSIGESGEGAEYTVRIVNATYATDVLYGPGADDGSRAMIYEQRITSTQSAGAEGVASQLELAARSDGRELWRIADDGNEGETLGEYYRTTEWGCCGAENTHRFYFAWTGKLAFTATADPLFLAIPNTRVRRALAYLSAYSVDGIDGEKYPQGAGLIALVDGDRTVDRVLLEAGEDSGFEWTPSIAFSDPTGEHETHGDTFDIWSADGNPDPAGLGGVDLLLGWDAETGIGARIPLVAGRLDLEHAQLPAGLTARHLAN